MKCCIQKIVQTVSVQRIFKRRHRAPKATSWDSLHARTPNSHSHLSFLSSLWLTSSCLFLWCSRLNPPSLFIFKKLFYFWDCGCILSPFLFLPSNPSIYSCLLSFEFRTSFSVNGWYIHTSVYTYILKYDLLSLYSVNRMHAFRADHSGLVMEDCLSPLSVPWPPVVLCVRLGLLGFFPFTLARLSLSLFSLWWSDHDIVYKVRHCWHNLLHSLEAGSTTASLPHQQIPLSNCPYSHRYVWSSPPSTRLLVPLLSCVSSLHSLLVTYSKHLDTCLVLSLFSIFSNINTTVWTCWVDFGYH